jgi:hypothetical protein
VSLQVVKSVKLSVEENNELRRRALDEGLFDHGFMRAAIRYALGLPLPERLEQSISRSRQQQIRPTR